MPIIEDPPEFLFPAGFKQLPIYAWRAFTNPTQSITSTVANPRPLSDIPSSIVCMVWYQSPPGDPILKTFDYGDSRPYIFKMPDGTTRINSTNMTAQAYQNLVDNIWSNDTYPT